MSPKRLTLRLAMLCVLALMLTPLVSAQTPGTCLLGSASADLDVNNVRARLFNNGGLFWKGAGNVYNVPKVLPGKPITPNAIFASGVWFGGQVDGKNRLVAADYGNWELWPGPLDDNGNLPGDGNCAKYDRIYVVSKQDLQDYVQTGVATPDLEAWPVGLGAPTVNNQGQPVVPTSRDQKIDLSAGQVPEFLGDQMAYWVMNDVGGAHGTTGTQPMGMEVQVTAFAFNLGGALGNTTFYKYKLIYKGKAPLTNAYFGVWSDPDLGNATDDYVGSDTTLGLGYVYNGDNDDEGSDGYGSPPPALGYDFFQGPLIDGHPDSVWVDPDGTEHPGKTRLGTTVFLYYDNITADNGNPTNGTDDWYKYLQGIWQNDAPMVDCGDGFNPAGLACEANAKPTKFMWPGDPVSGEFWSEINFDGEGNSNPPNDRRFLISTGPFVIQPGDVQEIVYGIVWARGADNLDSVARMKQDDAVAQSAYDNNFELAEPPSMPRVNVTELDGKVILSWYALPQDNNYLEQYEEFNPFSFDNGGDRTYNFEGYRIYQYPTEEFLQGDAKLIATYDVDNGIQRVIETDAAGLTTVVADGTDSGVQNSIQISGLTNYKNYYYGVEAYGVNLNTDILKVLASPVNKQVVMPSPVSAGEGGTVLDEGLYTDLIEAEAVVSNGEGVIGARILDPARVTGDTYEVRFYTYDPDGAEGEVEPFITYDIVNTTKGETVLNGREVADRTGAPLDQRPAIVVADGLEFNIQGPPNGFKDFLTTANAAGPLDPPEYAAFAFNSSGFPHPTTGDRPDGSRQQTTANIAGKGWGIHTFGNYDTFAEWFSRVTRDGGNASHIYPSDFEWRFTGSSVAPRAFEDGAIVTVPFQLWKTGTSPGPEDDVRLLPFICESGCGAGGADNVWDIGGDSPLSGGADDPVSDAIYWYEPADMTPGEAGYQAWAAKIASEGGYTQAVWDFEGSEIFARTVLMGWNFGAAAPYPMASPEQGTIFKISTFKPNQPNDVYAIDTAPFVAQRGVDSVATANIEDIGIVPNPYKGASAYEVSNLQDVARFVNMPERATIRIFTLSGTLIRTLEKSGPARHLDWDLQTEDALPIASGMYLIHVEVPGVGEKVIKFGVIKKRIQLDLL